MDETRLWRQFAAVAMGLLRWPPDVFWNATPAELYLAIEGMTGRGLEPPEQAPLCRAELDALTALFPDRTMRNR